MRNRLDVTFRIDGRVADEEPLAWRYASTPDKVEKAGWIWLAAMPQSPPITSLNSVGPRAGRTRDALVVAQVAVAIVLLVGAGLLLRSFSALTRVDTGIDIKNLLTFDMALSGARAEFQRTQVAFYDETLKALRSLPGVRGAGAAVTLPIGGDDFSAAYTVEGQPVLPADQELVAGYQVVTPGYFETMGIPPRVGSRFP